MRPTTDGKATVATLAAAEPLAPAPTTPFPATTVATRTVSAQALVAYDGNTYSVPPELARSTVTGTVTLGSGVTQIHAGPAVTCPGIACHRLAPSGAGASIRGGRPRDRLEHRRGAGTDPGGPAPVQGPDPANTVAVDPQTDREKATRLGRGSFAGRE